MTEKNPLEPITEKLAKESGPKPAPTTSTGPKIHRPRYRDRNDQDRPDRIGNSNIGRGFGVWMG
jgi:hypothetical protein